MFCTKQAPDNVIKRLQDVEIKAKGVKSVEDRMQDMEREMTAMKAGSVQVVTIEAMDDRMRELEAWKPFLCELDNKKILDMIAAFRKEQQ